MKKLLALIMGMIMLVTPVLSLAASPAEMVDAALQNGRAQKTTTSVKMNDAFLTMLGVDEETITLVTDLMDALAYSVTSQENGMTKFALELSGKEVIDLTFETTAEELYIASSLMGEKAVAMTEEEMWTTLGHIISYAAASGMIDESAAAEVAAILFLNGANSGFSARSGFFSATSTRFVNAEL